MELELIIHIQTLLLIFICATSHPYRKKEEAKKVEQPTAYDNIGWIHFVNEKGENEYQCYTKVDSKKRLYFNDYIETQNMSDGKQE